MTNPHKTILIQQTDHDAAVAASPMRELIALITPARDSLRDGLETPGMLEAEWSRHDRELVRSLDRALELLERRHKECYGADPEPTVS